MRNNEITNNIPWIDWTKTIGIFFVIWGHNWIIQDEIKQWIYSFHMPLFFILSGMLYKYQSLKNTIKKDCRRLLIPYFIYNIILLIIYSILHIYSHSFKVAFLNKSLIAICLGMGYSTDWATPVCDPGWFIISLFIMHILFSISFKRKITMPIIVIAGVLIVLFLNRFSLRTFIPLDSTLLAFPFFLFGYMYKNNILRIEKKAFSLIIAFLACVVNLFLNKINGAVDIDKCIYGHNIILFYLCGITGSLVVVSVCKLFCKKGNFFIYAISKGTIFILGFNLFIIGISRIICEYYSFYSSPILISFVDSLVILILFFIPIILLLKYSPFSLGIKNR